ncbi:SCO7613 C-terminal domain-containing membrane protein [Alloscardovia venturai]|uniref:SCO7613 C-terminal domain-containing membrane protein n=1 Tax=Alloscardovia venturai TaxID=1769421 RepID=A0ABW2Y648_9BIFI
MADSTISSLGFDTKNHQALRVRELNARIAALMEQRAVYLYQLFEKFHPGEPVPKFVWPTRVENLTDTTLEPDSFKAIHDVQCTTFGLDLTDSLAFKINDVSHIVVKLWSERNAVINSVISQTAQLEVHGAQSISQPLESLYTYSSENIYESVVTTSYESTASVSQSVTTPQVQSAQHAYAQSNPVHVDAQPAMQQPMQVATAITSPMPAMSMAQTGMASSAAMSTQPDAVRSSRGHMTTQNIMLGVGVGLVVLSAIAFLSVAFMYMGNGARALTIGIFGVLALVVAYLLRKRLHATAEGMNILGFGIFIVDVIFMSVTNVIPQYRGAMFAALPLALIAAVGWGMSTVTRQQDNASQLKSSMWISTILVLPTLFFMPFIMPHKSNEIPIYVGFLLVSLLMGTGIYKRGNKLTYAQYVWIAGSFVSVVVLMIPSVGYSIPGFAAAAFITPIVIAVVWGASIISLRRLEEDLSALTNGGSLSVMYAMDAVAALTVFLPISSRVDSHGYMQPMDIYILIGVVAAFIAWSCGRKLSQHFVVHHAQVFGAVVIGIETMSALIRAALYVPNISAPAYTYQMKALWVALLIEFIAVLWVGMRLLGVKYTEHGALIFAVAAIYLAASGNFTIAYGITNLVIATALIAIMWFTRRQYAAFLSSEKHEYSYASMLITIRAIAWVSIVLGIAHVSITDTTSLYRAIVAVLLIVLLIATRIGTSQGASVTWAVVLDALGTVMLSALAFNLDSILVDHVPDATVIVFTLVYATIMALGPGKETYPHVQIPTHPMKPTFHPLGAMVILEIATVILGLTFAAGSMKFVGLILFIGISLAAIAYWCVGRVNLESAQMSHRSLIGYLAVGNVIFLALAAWIEQVEPVNMPDVFSLVAGVVLFICAVMYLKHKPQLRSARTMWPALTVGLVPSFIISMTGTYSWQNARDVVLVIVLIGLLVYGAVCALKAPLLTGAIGLFVYALIRTWVIVAAVASQYWFITLFVAGAGLILLAAFFESIKNWAVKLWQMR